MGSRNSYAICTAVLILESNGGPAGFLFRFEELDRDIFRSAIYTDTQTVRCFLKRIMGGRYADFYERCMRAQDKKLERFAARYSARWLTRRRLSKKRQAGCR